MKVIKPPQEFGLTIEGPSVFLAGSIEMGKAIDWQTQIANTLADTKYTVFNPRRDDWDSSWEQKKTNPQFREQVLWELNALATVDYVVMYFDPNTKSPISLLELGIHKDNPGLIVCCPEGFWRKGNVDIVCDYYEINQTDSLEDIIKILRMNENEVIT